MKFQNKYLHFNFSFITFSATNNYLKPLKAYFQSELSEVKDFCQFQNNDLTNHK